MKALATAPLLAALWAMLWLAGCASRAPLEASARQGQSRVVTAESESASASAGSAPRRPAEPQKTCANCPTPDPDFAPSADEVPKDIENLPDAVVVDEPVSRHGNPKTYEALGKRYTIMPRIPKGFRESGRASWYGKKFHGRRTANGEIYDMFKMTAAHKTLPLPSYVRVTSKGNGRSVVVRINDRGPFHPGRIVDLSYAAAAKLDLLHAGSAEVQIEALTPQHGKNAAESEDAIGKPRYLEVGRFSDPIEALALRERLAKLGFSDTEFLQVGSPSGDGHESILRIGPFKTFSKLEAARVKLGLQEITAMPVAD